MRGAWNCDAQSAKIDIEPYADWAFGGLLLKILFSLERIHAKCEQIFAKYHYFP